MSLCVRKRLFPAAGIDLVWGSGVLATSFTHFFAASCANATAVALKRLKSGSKPDHVKRDHSQPSRCQKYNADGSAVFIAPNDIPPVSSGHVHLLIPGHFTISDGSTTRQFCTLSLDTLHSNSTMGLNDREFIRLELDNSHAKLRFQPLQDVLKGQSGDFGELHGLSPSELGAFLLAGPETADMNELVFPLEKVLRRQVSSTTSCIIRPSTTLTIETQGFLKTRLLQTSTRMRKHSDFYSDARRKTLNERASDPLHCRNLRYHCRRVSKSASNQI